MMFTVQGSDPANPVLIPLVESWISQINEKTSTIYMDLPGGLIDLNLPTAGAESEDLDDLSEATED